MYCMYLFGTSKLCSSLTQFVWPHCVLLYVLCWLYIHKMYNTWSGDHLYHGSHRDWKSGKTWKNGKAFSSQGKVREFCEDWKSQGILPKILEKQENLNKKNVFL